MAAALFPVRGNSPPSLNQVNTASPRTFLSDFDVDNRYPNTTNVRLSTTSPHVRSSQPSSLPYTDYDSSPLQLSSTPYGEPSYMAPQWAGANGVASSGSSTRPTEEDRRNSYFLTRDDVSADIPARQTPSIRQQTSFRRDSLSSFQGNNRASIMERQYSIDEEDTRAMQAPSRNTGDSRSVSTYVESRPQLQRPTSSNQLQQNYDRPTSLFVPPPSNPKTSMGTYGDNGRPYSQAPGPSPYPAIQVAPKYRAYAPQPAYTSAPNPANPPFSTSPQQPQEEVCVECAMRDQDMADVDVTSPGVWDRESDIHFHELARLEHEEEINGITSPDPSRPRTKGGRLSEQNLKIWLSVNPREPASRKQTLDKYLRSQITLLEAEALAHARAMQEAKQLDSRMRDAYSQLRRSAYDTGSSATPADDAGGVRIKPPHSPNEAANPVHTRSLSRDVTLLENGMIVEHVDVRKEEKEARERQRKEEKRARKASRSSTMDVTSVYSAASQSTPMFDGLMASPDLRYPPMGSGRPTSVLTAPMERPRIPRASSQASFSDVHSLGSLSPRRTRFFGFKNLSGGFRSQDSLAPSGYSGSMVDMHVALQREGDRRGAHDNVSPLRRSQVWPMTEPAVEEGDSMDVASEGKKSKKKKRGLRKIWSIVTGSKNNNTSSRAEPKPSQSQPLDDVPLAPPPSLSYLVNRSAPGELSSARHSTASLHSTTGSPRLMTPGVSPPTAPSSLLPSPSSSRPDMDAELRKSQAGLPYVEEPEQMVDYQAFRRNDNDLRGRSSPMSVMNSAQGRPLSVMSRDKSLPPLPIEGQHQPQLRPLHPYQQEIRPRTMYTYDSRTLPLGASPPLFDSLAPPQAPFRAENVRRQSFGGITNRPQLHLQTMPSLGNTLDRKSFGIRYDEFGSSRRSLGRLDLMPTEHATPSTTSKRKSRFALVSLFGKKMPTRETNDSGLHQFPSTRSGSSGDEDMMNVTNTSFSRHSVAPRMSMVSVSRKVEELIPQDPDFVAYRYPSNDQELNLLR